MMLNYSLTAFFDWKCCMAVKIYNWLKLVQVYFMFYYKLHKNPFCVTGHRSHFRSMGK